MNNETLKNQQQHWKQVRRDARKQYEYARQQYNLVTKKIAELAIEKSEESDK